jgi:ribosomal protein S18 acetylase RimI-like enzyme
MNVKFEKVSYKQDIEKVARLHKRYISSGFLSSLGERFLEILYNYISRSEESFCIVAKHNGKVIGFISGTENVSKLYKGFIKENFLNAIVVLLPSLFNPLKLLKILETLFYPKKKKIVEQLPDAELLSIVVDENFQGKNVAFLLFNELIKEFKKRNIYTFKIIVGSKLKKAIKFYEKMGCEKVGEIEVHKGEISFVYIYHIEGKSNE